ncbi:YslB family protein [Sediminibacillus massiliensis]|uniref:YslB family protein n=1 Tax=Sediminibacillus massiliensis TaxID=1926277 RepID=UPI000988848B|nr:YslB family protein [Sediminibacillus massiliensis]
MERNRHQLDKNLMEHLHTTGAGYDVLRYICLPDLLGKEAAAITYVMGKNLARKLEPATVEELIECFSLFGWGHLELKKEKRREMVWELSGESVRKRHQSPLNEIDYRLEAGFLAESIQQIKETACECLEEVNTKQNTIQLSVIYTK